MDPRIEQPPRLQAKLQFSHGLLWPSSLPSMASDIPMQIAETIQTAHVNRAPSAAHDINPSTAADAREPVVLEDAKVEDREEEDDIPTSVLRPQRRFSHLPPLPSVAPNFLPLPWCRESPS